MDEMKKGKTWTSCGEDGVGALKKFAKEWMKNGVRGGGWWGGSEIRQRIDEERGKRGEGGSI